jgi:peptidoglycan/LPS O-acetylase OafA/YrhL
MKTSPIDHQLGMLDGLRGLMSVWVVLGHACLLAGYRVRFLDEPGNAVSGFMLLSGFLMTYHYQLRSTREPWSEPATWAAFWIRRFFRISPLYYVMLIPSFLMMQRYAGWRMGIDTFIKAPFRFATAPPVDSTNILLHLTDAFGVLPRYSSTLVIPDWSLSLEMQFYFFFPFFILLAARIGWIAFGVCSAAIWFISHRLQFVQGFPQPSLLPASLIYFAIGMIWAGHYLNPKRRIRGAIIGCVLALCVHDRLTILLILAFAAVLFVERFGMNAIRRLLSGRVSRFLADASFSVYLTHLLFLTPITYYLATGTTWGVRTRFWAAALCTIVISYSIAKPLEFIERYGHTYGKVLAQRVLFHHAKHGVHVQNAK